MAQMPRHGGSDITGKGQISTPYKIETAERIGMKFGTVDYVLEITPEPNLVTIGSARASG